MPAKVDQQQLILEERCRAFVPPNAFDAHAHLYRAGVGGDAMRTMWTADGRDIGFDQYQTATRAWLADRTPSSGLFFAFPAPNLDIADANAFVAEQVETDANSRGLMLIRPDDDPDKIDEQVQRFQFAGFKVYHVYTNRPDTFYADIDEFLPPWAWEIADRRGLSIMLHMVKPRALADPDNQRVICQRCRQFPHAKLILAHAARGFCARHTTEGIDAIRSLDNVFFDTSAICEPEAFRAILKTFGPQRLLFGTDFPVSEKRAKCVTVGDGFAWLEPPMLDWAESPFAEPTRVGVESILALQDACLGLHLNDSDIERIFRDNAHQLLNIGTKLTGEQTDTLYRRGKQLIPGGTQLLSKRPEMFAPERWPAYFREARGCTVTDLDGRQFIDMTTSGIGSCLLGYRDPDVTAAVMRRIELGSMSTLNPPEEVELAELLVSLHPWAEQARFARTGGEAMAVAVRLARAATGRDRVALCGYHGWSDWYLAANLSSADGDEASRNAPAPDLLPGLEPAGVPKGLTDTALPFHFNQLEELEAIFAERANDLAAVVMEPTRSSHPEPSFLESVPRALRPPWCRACAR